MSLSCFGHTHLVKWLFLDGWVDGWMGAKAGTRDCLAGQKILIHSQFAQIFSFLLKNNSSNFSSKFRLKLANSVLLYLHYLICVGGVKKSPRYYFQVFLRSMFRSAARLLVKCLKYVLCNMTRSKSWKKC